MAKRTTPKDAGTIDQVAVLARWRETRSPRLADLLCSAVDDVWTATIAELVDKTIGWSMPRVQALPDDPRTTVFLVGRMASPWPWQGAKSRPLWAHVFDRLVQLRDVRCIDTLRAYAAKPPDFFQPKTTAWAAGEMARVADELAALKLPADDAETTRLAKAQTVVVPVGGFFARESTANVDALLEQVWARPDDLELRAVIGDALQELGDVRGELIALQLRGKRATTAGIRKLIYENEKHLGGPIAEVTPHAGNHLEFEAGFLVACNIGTSWATKQDWERAAVAPHWATVERVAFFDTPKQKWFQAWWDGANLGKLRDITSGEVILGRASRTAPWTFKHVPRTLAQHELKRVELLLRTMPRAELARIEPPPAEHPIGALVRTIRKM